MTIDDINNWSEGRFPGHMGIKITALEGDGLRAEMPIQSHFLAPNGYLHAGSLVTFADTIAGYSVRRHLRDGAKSFTTIELKSNFIRTLREGVVECVSEPEHIGRTTQVWRVKVVDKSTQKVMAIFSCTQLIIY